MTSVGCISQIRTHVHTEPQPAAVLDLHFQGLPGKQDILGAVSSVGTLSIYRFLGPGAVPGPLAHLSTLRVPQVGEDVLFLSFAWHPSMEGVVAVTTSHGHVHILRLDSDYGSARSATKPVVSHSLEVWCVAIYPSVSTDDQGLPNGQESFTLFTGGDDSTLRYLSCDVAEGPDVGALQLNIPFPPAAMRGHGAGVTAVLPLPLGKQDDGRSVIVTGSYDDHIRIYSIVPLHKSAGMRRERLLGEFNLGGGVWRLKLIQVEKGDPGGTWRIWLLASCMHAGARIVEIRGSDGEEACELTILGRFEEHKSMNYAGDIRPGYSGGELVCVSTSFYDRLLCLWKLRTTLTDEKTAVAL